MGSPLSPGHTTDGSGLWKEPLPERNKVSTKELLVACIED